MIFNLHMSDQIAKKLANKHDVTFSEIKECFLNRCKGLLEDTREQHKTRPPTLWFIAETNDGRILKIVFIELENRKYEIKTAYEPNHIEVKIYEDYA
jgi:uncharacterized DUF497 family protein